MKRSYIDRDNESLSINDIMYRVKKLCRPKSVDIIDNSEKIREDNEPKTIRVVDLIDKEYSCDPFYEIYESTYISKQHYFYKIWKISKEEENVSLTPQHFKITNDIYNGNNVFVTGKAGTGKSHLLRKIIKILKKDHGNESIGICAPTATAGVNVGATTFHSLFGLTPERKKVESVVKKIKQNGKSQVLGKLKCLIIDEISQITPYLFDDGSNILCKLATNVINNEHNHSYLLPYGGVQIIVFGDFKQIGPIVEKNADIRYSKDTETWKKLKFKITMLEHIFRQKGDREFVDILNEISNGYVSPLSELKLKQRIVDQKMIDKMEIKPLPILGRRHDADVINNQHIDSLEGSPVEFTSNYGLCHKQVLPSGKVILEKYEPNKKTDITWPVNHLIKFKLDEFKTLNPIPPVKLKINARVMLTANIDIAEGFVNGLLGIVLNFDDNGFPYIKFENGKVALIRNIRREKKFKMPHKKYPNFYLYVKYLPIVVAAAISIHKCQGKTLRMIDLTIDLRNIFTYHMGYCALSRATSLDGVYLRKFEPHVIKIDPVIKEFYEQLENEKEEFIRCFKKSKEMKMDVEI